MRVVKPGLKRESWTKEVVCEGTKLRPGCEAVLSIDESDVFIAYYTPFMLPCPSIECPECGTLTPINGYPPYLQARTPNYEEWKRRQEKKNHKGILFVKK